MYTVTVRSHMMIAHSLSGPVFGPAQRLHGATYVVDVDFRRPVLDSNGIVVDIGAATTVLEEVLGALTYRNLDDEPAFAGVNTTTEVLARFVFDQLKDAIAAKRLGQSADGLQSLRVVLHESHVASAAYEADLTE